jgi:hypothetical protein
MELDSDRTIPFFKKHMWDSLPNTLNPCGFSMYTSSIRPFINVVFTSILWIFQSIYATMAIILLMEVYIAIIVNVSS